MRLACSGEDCEWAKTSATKLIRFSSFMVTMDQLLISGGYFGMTAEIGGGDGLIAPQFAGLATQHDTTGFQHVAVIGDRKSHAGVLLHQEHRGVAPDFRDDPDPRLHDDGR